MRTYGRNVRRAWDGDDYRAPKRQRLENGLGTNSFATINRPVNESVLDLYDDEEDSLERAIRETSVAALSSSPSRKNSTVFSTTDFTTENEASHALTPPSSPPPELHITPPNIKIRKPAFSFLEKKKQKEKEKAKQTQPKASSHTTPGSAPPLREISEPLSEIHNSSTRAASQSSQPPLPPKPTLIKSLTQSVLDFGQSLQPVTCTQCQMSYTPSVPEDTQLHQMYHNRHSQGIELGKPFLKSAMKWCYEVPHIPGSVVVVDRKISLPGRRVVQRVLEVVNKELGSADITEAELWSQKSLEDEEADESAKKVDRYKVFLHVIDGKCVGVCLAERIAKAYRVEGAVGTSTKPLIEAPKQQGSVQDEDGSNSIPTPISSSSPDLSVSETPEPSKSSADLTLAIEPTAAVVGVSRIWTSKAFRRKGIAQNLLECVTSQFIYGLEIEREQVAFSQPTEFGVGLARGWYGENSGWCVYMES